MKFIVTADLHIRGKRPQMRCDDYVAAQFGKLNYIVETCIAENATLIIAGDIFDRHDVSLSVLARTCDYLRRLPQGLLFCRGNHDTAFHSKDIMKSPLGILTACGLGECLTSTTPCKVLGDVNVFGLGWQEEFDQALDPEQFNILVAHFSVYENKPPHYMLDALSVENFEKKFPGFDLYLVGDIHIPCQKSKTLVPGSTMRLTSTQVDYRPCCWVLDIEQGSYKFSERALPISENSFDLQKIEESKNQGEQQRKAEEQLELMTKKLQSESEVISFEDILSKVIENEPIEVKTVIQEVMT